jgi:hypothetical protein
VRGGSIDNVHFWYVNLTCYISNKLQLSFLTYCYEGILRKSI